MKIRYKKLASLMGLNGVNAILGIFYSYIMMHHYGTSDIAKIFFAASLINQSIVKLSQAGNLLEFIVPIYFREKNLRGEKAADNIFAIVINNMLLITLVILLIISFSIHIITEIYFPGFLTSDQEMIRHTFIIISGLTIFQVVNGMFQGLLIAKKYFGRAEFTNSVSLVFSSLVLFLLGDANSIYPLITAMFISTGIQSLSILIALFATKYKHKWALKSTHFTTKQLFKSLSTTSVYVFSTQVYSIFFNSALSFLPGNIFTIFRYSEMIWTRVSSLILTPFNTIFFSDFSQLLSESSDTAKIKNYFLNNLNIVIVLSLFVFLSFYAGSFPMFWLLFKSKNMPFNDVYLLFIVVIVFIGTMLLTSLQSIYRKVVSSAILADKQYLFYAVFHVFSAFISSYLLKLFYFNGLIVSIIFHSALMLFASVLVLVLYKKELFVFVSLNQFIRIVFANILAFLCIYFTKNRIPSIENFPPVHLFFLSFVLCAEYIVLIFVLYRIFGIKYLDKFFHITFQQLKSRLGIIA